MAALLLVVVAGALAWCLLLLDAQLSVGEAARAAARVAARGEGDAAAILEARRLVPDAAVSLRSSTDHVVITVTDTLRPPGLLARWGRIRLAADAVAAREAAS